MNNSLNRPRPLPGQDIPPLISLEDARLHLGLDATGSPPTHFQDGLVVEAVEAARDFLEGYTEQAFGARSFLQVDRTFPGSGPLLLRMGPHVQLVSIEYQDENNDTQSLDLAELIVDPYGDRGLIYPTVDYRWPRTYDSPVAVRTTFVAGFGETSASPIQEVHPLPKLVRRAALIIVGHLFENREQATEKALATIPLGAMDLIQRYRIGMGL